MKRNSKNRNAALKWQCNNPEKVKKSHSKYYQKNKHRWQEWHLKNHYGITLKEYTKFVQKQGGCCAICSLSILKTKLVVDHDHLTKKVRGLLCPRCNNLLGMASDDPKILEKAIEYIRT